MLVTSALSLLAVQLGSSCSRVCVQPTATHSLFMHQLLSWCDCVLWQLCLLVTPYRTALRLSSS